MRLSLYILVFLGVVVTVGALGQAYGFRFWDTTQQQDEKVQTAEQIKQHQNILEALAPHKALYDINLAATRSGSQIVNISGKMFFEWKPTCDSWVTDHKFSLFYEYADSPSMMITSDFSTLENFDGEAFNFSARRSRNGDLYQEIRGLALTQGQKAGEAGYTMPAGLEFDLDPGTLFPMAHSVALIKAAKQGHKFHHSHVFDGSDDEGPVEISSFVGEKIEGGITQVVYQENPKIDVELISAPAWKVRMAVFPTLSDEAISDYEMDMIFHDNGVISDMLVEYDDFSVTQKLVALEKVEKPACQ